jgi:hypothetical protein
LGGEKESEGEGMSLPIRYDDQALTVCVADPGTGEMVPIKEASDRAILEAETCVDELRREVTAARYAIGAEMRERYGIGTSREAGYVFKVQETTNWPLGATKAVLKRLVDDHVIYRSDMDRALPLKPKPDAVQLKALIGRLTVSDPKAAAELAACATVSQPSLRDLREEAVTSEAVES